MERIITRANVDAAASVLRAAAPDFEPKVALILGSGLNSIAESINQVAVVPYEGVPHMASSTVPMHEGRFILGTLADAPVVCMQGRLHMYEGYTAHQVGFPIHVMRALGAEKIIVTNAAGGIDPSFEVGDLMLITDHINFQFTNPCIPASDEMGLRFFDMTQAYSPRLRELAYKAAEANGIALRKGVYSGDLGPGCETPAEIRAFRALGADAVGMSTVQEVIAARYSGMEVLGISMISNPAAGVQAEPLDMDDVLVAAHLAAAKLRDLIEAVLPSMA